MATLRVVKAPRLFGDRASVRDADPRTPGDLHASQTRRDKELWPREIPSVVRARQPQRARDSSRTIRAFLCPYPQRRLSGANEHGVSRPFAQADDVEAVVHPVDQEHVGVSGRPEKRARPPGEPGSRMGRAVRGTPISFGLDNSDRSYPLTRQDLTRSARGGPTRDGRSGDDEVGSDEIPGDKKRVAREERVPDGSKGRRPARRGWRA
jgi:hypothetical protein